MTDEVNKQDEEIAAIEDVAIDTEESGNKFSRGIHSHKSRYSAYSFFTWVCVFSFVSVNSGWGLACINGLFSILSIVSIAKHR